MHIAAVGWIYVVLMMAITEDSVVAGIMTFLFYGVLPVALIMYVAGTGNRKRRRAQEEAERLAQKLSDEASTTAKSESANPN
jgi:predicted DNA repair protein MutK